MSYATVQMAMVSNAARLIRPSDEQLAAMKKIGMQVEELWGEASAVSGQPENEETLGWEQLSAVIKQFRLREPHITAIWCIDRPAEYEQLAAQLPQVESGAEHPSPLGFAPLPLPRIDLHDWRTEAFDPRTEVIASPLDGDVAALLRRGNMEKMVWPWVCAIPGVWAHLSDGRYQMVQFTRSQEEAI